MSSSDRVLADQRTGLQAVAREWVPAWSRMRLLGASGGLGWHGGESGGGPGAQSKNRDPALIGVEEAAIRGELRRGARKAHGPERSTADPFETVWGSRDLIEVGLLDEPDPLLAYPLEAVD